MAKNVFFLRKSAFFLKKYLVIEDFLVILQTYSEVGTNNSLY